MSELSSVTIDGNLSPGYELRENDILTVRSNGSKDLVGRCMLVPAVDEVVSYSGFVIRIRFDVSKIASKFLLNFMRCSETRKELTRGGGGANISNINQEKLSALMVPVPPIKEQLQIANRVDELRAETAKLETIYSNKLIGLDALKQSLLREAFSGRL